MGLVGSDEWEETRIHPHTHMHKHMEGKTSTLNYKIKNEKDREAIFLMKRTGDAVGVVLRHGAHRLRGGHEGGAVALGKGEREVVHQLWWSCN